MNITDLVKERLANSGPDVQTLVVGRLADREIEARTQLVLKAVEKIVAEEKALAKITAQPTGYTAEGTPVLGFSPAQFQDKQKRAKLLDELNSALDEALSKSNFDKLKKLVGEEKGEKPAVGAE